MKIDILILIGCAAASGIALGSEDILSLDGQGFRVSVDPKAGGFRVEDSRGGAVWTSAAFQVRLAGEGWKGAEGLRSKMAQPPGGKPRILLEGDPVSFRLSLARGDRSAEVSWSASADAKVEAVRLLSLGLSKRPGGETFLVVPAREGLLFPLEGPPFRRAFDAAGYEGCHMNVLALVQGGSTALVTWDDAYVTAEAARREEGPDRALSLDVRGRKSARSVLFTPLGKGGLAEAAAAYRGIAQEKGLRADLRSKMATRPELERLIGASSFKLWTCLERKMSENSQKEVSLEVHWTFGEAAQVAEHLRRDLGIDRCHFTVSGWIHRGYDCQHPDVLPAAPECGGNDALRDALQRIQALGYADCLHDNYQDIYRDSPSWSEDLIQKRADGSLAAGGHWLGGRAYLVCAPKTLELARRPGNLPEVKRLFQPLTYFIDTTYAVDPQECFDPAHPLSRNDDIRWKAALSDYAREVFGIFGSECGREWAIPHSDFFEGLVGVSGKYFHNLDPASIGAAAIPFFEMVYHDCEIAYGKYGFDPDRSDETVVHHVSCARPLYHHGIPKGLYWKRLEGDPPARGAFTRADNGWAEGLCRTDRFLKNTHEVLGPLHRETAHLVLERLEFLSPDRSLRRLAYGKDEVLIHCNFGSAGARVNSALLGDMTLPQWGFLVESPRFIAFHATAWGGAARERSGLFTLASLDGKPLAESKMVRLFHGFGPAGIAFRGKSLDVRREVILELP